MKQLLLAFSILIAATGVFCALQGATAKLRQENSTNLKTCQEQSRLITRTRVQREDLIRRVRESRRDLGDLVHSAAAQSQLAANVPKPGQPLSPGQREKLLAQLGFNWNSSGGYVVVSKATLRDIRLPGMKGMKLTDIACQVLAITPPERDAVEAMTRQLGQDYRAWAQAHIQRKEPSGAILADYTLPSDAQFSQGLSNTFTNGVISTLGEERGDLLLEYARSWMNDLGMTQSGVPDAPTTMIIRRDDDGEDLSFELKQAGSTMQTFVSPWQPFPEAFRPLFPGGWPDLAAREGFQLPKSFSKSQTNSGP